MDNVLVEKSEIRHDFITGEGKHNYIPLGRKGRTFLEAGYIYAPYIPMIVEPTIMENPNDFQPTSGVMTRYATTVVNNRFYGEINVGDFDSMGDESD
jgi:hypothetical protein